MFMLDPYKDMIALEGEPFAIVSADGSNSGEIRGMYDRRILVGEVAGAEVRIPDHLVGCVQTDVPDWVEPGTRIDIRGDTCQVTAIEPDGQGLLYLTCRAAT